jgi:enoyl-[acyl-carrier protein] reductase II
MDLFGIKYPIIQGGMIWCSGWKLASAVSNSGGLGLIGAGSMYPDVFLEHIQKCKAATDKPFGVNIPLIYPDSDKLIEIVLNEDVKIVFTSAGNPKKYTKLLQENGVKVAHVVSNSKFALKSQEAGVNAVVAEGFEAGGHNGIEELTTMSLIPEVSSKINIPLISAGGIYSGRSILAALSLGADGVQIGSLFAASEESSAHINFKNAIINSKEGNTSLRMKKLIPVRLLDNEFSMQVKEAEDSGASAEELKILLGRARAKRGMHEGDIEQGELEIGQISAHLNKIEKVELIMKNLIKEFREVLTHEIQLKSKF